MIKALSYCFISIFGLFYTSYVLAQPKFDFQKQLNLLSKATEVTVTTRRPGTGAPYEKVKIYPKYTCTYSSSNRELISQLVMAFKQANTRKAPPNLSFLPLVQTEVYFTLEDESKVTILLAPEYLNEPYIDGEMSFSSENIPLYADRTLTSAIFYWIRSTGQPIINNSLLERKANATTNRSAHVYNLIVRNYKERCSTLPLINYYRNKKLENQRCNRSFFDDDPVICWTGWK